MGFFDKAGAIGVLAGGVTGLITNIFAARLASKQRKEANRLRERAEARRVDYKTPTAITDKYNEAKMDAQGSSALQRLLEDKAQRSGADYLSQLKKGATSSSQLLNKSLEMQTVTNQQMNEAAVSGYQDQVRKEAILRDSQSEVGDYKDQEYEMNVNRPYLMDIQQSNELLGAATQNKFNAFANMGNVATSAAGMIGDGQRVGRKKRRRVRRPAPQGTPE